MGYPCTGGQTHAFMIYLAELRKWNRAYNLTALVTDDDIVRKHFLDSLLFLKAMPADLSAMKIADAGSGAGFPGIPIKIMRPEADITLLEPSRKKTAFIRHMVRTLHYTAGITVLEKRLERLGKKYERSFDFILSRATFSIGDLLEKACPYVREKGRLVLSKGPRAFDEIDSLESSQRKRIERVLRLGIMELERNLLILACPPSPSAEA